MKVKNIMFSGFAAAILMGVVAEANAAPVAVASKGYVDSVAGKLLDLEDAARGKTNLVDAVNVKQDKLTAGKFIAIDPETDTITTTYTGGRNITIDDQGAIHANGLQETLTAGNNITIENGTISATGLQTALTAGDNIDIVDGVISATDTTYEGEGYITVADGKIKTTLKEGTNVTIGADGSINATDTTYEGEGYITVADGKIKTTLKEGTNVTIGADGSINAKTYTGGDNITVGDDGTISATGLQKTLTAGDFINIDEQTGEITTTYTGGRNITIDDQGAIHANGLQETLTAGTNITIDNGTISAKQYTGSTNITVDQATGVISANGLQKTLVEGDFINIDEQTGEITTTYTGGTNITIGADGTINTRFPAMPAACSADGVTCVLTSEGGNFVWAVLTTPVSDSIVSGLAAQGQGLPTELYTAITQ